MNDLTAKQKEVLKAIRQYYSQFSVSPTLEEIGEIVGIDSRAGVHHHLGILEEKGYISRGSKNRDITIKDEISFTSIPVLGVANAGEPLAIAEEDNMGCLEIDSRILKNKGNLFAVKIKGDSMNQVVINKTTLVDDSYAIVDKDEDYNEGDIVLAIINNGATIKRLRYIDNAVVLVPDSSNPKHQPIYIKDSEGLFINGKIVLVLQSVQ